MASIMTSQDRNTDEMQSVMILDNTLQVTQYPKGDPGATYEPKINDAGEFVWTDQSTGVDTDPVIKSAGGNITIGDFDTKASVNIHMDTTEDKQLDFDFTLPQTGTYVKPNGENKVAETSLYAPTAAPSIDTSEIDTNRIVAYDGTSAAAWKKPSELGIFSTADTTNNEGLGDYIDEKISSALTNYHKIYSGTTTPEDAGITEMSNGDIYFQL